MKSYNRIKSWYVSGGISNVVRRIWEHILLYSFVAPYLKSFLGDVLHHKLIMSPRLKYWPSINEPKTFNEKIMHRKIFTNNDLYVEVSDKWKVREYVAEKVGDEILNEVYLVIDEPETIPFETLPNKFVIKATPGSGTNIFVENKNNIDKEKVKTQCFKWMSREYSPTKYEYWYHQIEPKIIIEKYIEDSQYGVPLDFKFFVFHGEVKYIQVDYDRFSNHTRRIYDRNWTPLELSLKYPLGPVIDEPELFDKMVDISEKLGSEFDFVRVDLYQPTSDQIIFGEMTISPGAGGERFDPEKYDLIFGSHW